LPISTVFLNHPANFSCSPTILPAHRINSGFGLKKR